MKLVQPIVLKEIDKKLILPLYIFKTAEGITSYLENFTIEEKEQYFKIKIDKIDPKGLGLTYQSIGFSNPTLMIPKFMNHIITPYKITLSGQTDNPSELQNEKDIMEFVFKNIVGCGLPVSIITDTATMYNGNISMANDKPNSRRENKIIDDQIRGRIQRLMQILHSTSVDRNKVDLIKSLLSIAMSPVPLGISGAFYVSILESIFVRDKDTEIGYRFSMRLSKMRNATEEYRKKIKKLYDKRSKIFHLGHNDFSVEDVKFLEEEASWAIEEYINNPDSFSTENLDRKLLGL